MPPGHRGQGLGILPELPSIRAVVVGAGAFGRNHIRVYRELEAAGYQVSLSAIVEADPSLARALREEFGIPVFASVEQLIEALDDEVLGVDAASVCVPTSAHFAVASALLSRHIDVLVEKPIAPLIEQADALVETAAKNDCILQVGHLERFNPAVTTVRPILNGPMFFEAHRLSVFTSRSLDIDVVLDLMIHDLDIVLSFVASPIAEVRAVGLPILSPKVDIANVRLEFESGCVANFTASRASTERVRKLRFFQPHQYISIDYARQDLLVIDVAGQHASSPSEPPSQALRFSKPATKPGEPLRFEIESFLDAVRTRTRPVVSGEDGRAALALALQINSDISEHARRAGLDRFPRV